MANNLIGVGRIYVTTSINGMSDEDWAALTKVIPRLEFNGEISTVEEGVEINRVDKNIRFIYEFLDEGDYFIGIECHYNDGLWSRSFRNEAVTVTDAFSMAVES